MACGLWPQTGICIAGVVRGAVVERARRERLTWPPSPATGAKPGGPGGKARGSRRRRRGRALLPPGGSRRGPDGATLPGRARPDDEGRRGAWPRRPPGPVAPADSGSDVVILDPAEVRDLADAINPWFSPWIRFAMVRFAADSGLRRSGANGRTHHSLPMAPDLP